MQHWPITRAPACYASVPGHSASYILKFYRTLLYRVKKNRARIKIYGTVLCFHAYTFFDQSVPIKKVPRSKGEPGIFLIFAYFLPQMQRLRPLVYCAPHKSVPIKLALRQAAQLSILF